MKGFKEWLSDNLRYLILLAAILLGVAAIVLGMKLYRAYRADKEQRAPVETVENQTGDVVILSDAAAGSRTRKTDGQETENRQGTQTQGTAPQSELQTEETAKQGDAQTEVDAQQSGPQTEKSAQQSGPQTEKNAQQSEAQTEKNAQQSEHQTEETARQSETQTEVSVQQSERQTEIAAAQQSEEMTPPAAERETQTEKSALRAETQTDPADEDETQSEEEQSETAAEEHTDSPADGSEEETQTDIAAETETEAQTVVQAVTEQQSEPADETEQETDAPTEAQTQETAVIQILQEEQSEPESEPVTESVEETQPPAETSVSGEEQTEGARKVSRPDVSIVGQSAVQPQTERTLTPIGDAVADTDSSEVQIQSETPVQTETVRETEEIDTLKSMTASTKYASTQANIRSGPGTQYTMLTDVDQGEAVQVTGQTTSWYQVKLDGRTGYINKSLVTDVYTPVYMTMTGTCYLRSEADYGDNIIGEYYAGTTVEFLGDAGGWIHVRVDGQDGYMGSRFFQ